MKNIMYKAFLLIACSLCVLSCTDLDEEVAVLNKSNIETIQVDTTVIKQEPLFVLNKDYIYFYANSLYYDSYRYHYIYCDKIVGNDVSVSFDNVPNWLTVKYKSDTHVIEIYKNDDSRSDVKTSFYIIASDKSKEYKKEISVIRNDAFSDGYFLFNTSKEYEVSADTKTLEVDFSKDDDKCPAFWKYSSSTERYYYATPVGLDSWVTGIAPAGATKYISVYGKKNAITLTFQPNTTGADRTTMVRVYTMKTHNMSNNTDIYGNCLIYTFKITQKAQ